MGSQIIAGILGILFTTGGSVWLVIYAIRQLEQTTEGFVYFSLIAAVILIITRALFIHFLDIAKS